MTSEIVTVGTLLESYDIDDCGELFKVLPCLLGPITYESQLFFINYVRDNQPDEFKYDHHHNKV